jgi:hypothetical protein
MVGIGSIVFVYFIINSISTVTLISIREVPANDIIVDIEKAYALRRVGIYSPNFVEQIVHTFIPLDNYCVTSPNKGLCLYGSSPTKTNMVELATMMASRHTLHALSSYNKDSVSRIIGNDISRVLAKYRPNEIMKDTKSVVHFINNQLHYQKRDDKALMVPPSTNVIDNYSGIRLLPPTPPVDTIVKQINSNQIGFDYLSSIDLNLFLSAIFSSSDTSYPIADIQETLNHFDQLIVGQSVVALRYCSLNRQNSVLSQPCLAISTLFLQAPADNATTFSIYRLIPLPIIDNGDKYVYTNLPKLVGINSKDQTLIIWNDESYVKECTFTPFVQCQQMPVTTSLSKSLCLSQLFDNNQLTTSACKVIRSQNIDQGVMHIGSGIYLFYDVLQTQYCQIYSTSNELVETISINEAALVRMPCNNTILCTDVALTASSCTPRRVIVTPAFSLDIHNPPRFNIPIKNMTETLVSAYQLQLKKSMAILMAAFRSKQSSFKKIMSDFGEYILSAICLIFFMLFIYVIKMIKFTLQRQINKLTNFVLGSIRV